MCVVTLHLVRRTTHIPTLPFGPSAQLEFLSLPFPPCCALAWLPKTTHGVGCELNLVLCLWVAGYSYRAGTV